MRLGWLLLQTFLVRQNAQPTRVLCQSHLYRSVHQITATRSHQLAPGSNARSEAQSWSAVALEPEPNFEF